MKLCKDCVHIQQSGLNIFCSHPDNPSSLDVVTGHRIGGTDLCANVRRDERRCGLTAMWFEPATLDGKLDMLEHNTATIYFVTFEDALPKAYKYRSAAEKASGKSVTPIEYWDKQ